jgi:hypothetical protein
VEERRDERKNSLRQNLEQREIVDCCDVDLQAAEQLCGGLEGEMKADARSTRYDDRWRWPVMSATSRAGW